MVAAVDDDVEVSFGRVNNTAGTVIIVAISSSMTTPIMTLNVVLSIKLNQDERQARAIREAIGYRSSDSTTKL